MNISNRPAVVLMFLAGSLAGCGGDSITTGPSKTRVSGQIFFDRKPLPDGQIQFIDETGDPPLRYVADIRNGNFSCECTPGSKRVEVMAFKAGGNTAYVPGPGDNPQYIPAKYNSESTLKIVVEADKPNESLKFDLDK